MIGLDTNVLVRYIMQDDAKQSAQASALMESLTVEESGFVAVVAVIELFWVLGTSYRLSRAQVAQALDLLLRLKEIRVDQASHVARALRVYEASAADFADCLIERISAGAGCLQTMTFDVGASKVAGMVLIS